MSVQAPSSPSAPEHCSAWSSAAQQALRKPPRRGTFRPLDAARRQLALLTVGDGIGQARIWWLIDLEHERVEDARFLAFGSLSSHPLANAFCEAAMGQPLREICTRDPATFESSLRDDAQTPAFADMPDLSFIAALQQQALAQIPHLHILPKPVEVERYVRKREQEWSDADRAWLPLSLMKKLMLAQKVGNEVISERTGRSPEWSVEGLHDDFQLMVRFQDVAAEERPLLIGFLSSEFKNRIHPDIVVEEAAS